MRPQRLRFVMGIVLTVGLAGLKPALADGRPGADLCSHDGDVSADGVVSAEDAQLAFFIVLGQLEPTTTQRCAADCNGDGVLTASDSQAIFWAVLGGPRCPGQCVRFVNVASIAPQPDGLTWATAYPDVQAGIDSAFAATGQPEGPAVCEVWVAEGNYVIYQTSREDTVQLRPGVGLYGGFEGSEILRMQRDWDLHETVLDGANQCDHVVTGSDDALLDGLTITRGRSDDLPVRLAAGGGMYNVAASPTVRNCAFVDNVGGMYNENSAVIIAHSTFVRNEMDLWSVESAPVVTDCRFTPDGGTAMANWDSASLITDSIFDGNDGGGEAISNWGGTLTIAGCMFSGFSWSWSGVVHNHECALTISDSSFVDNTGWDVAATAIRSCHSTTVVSGCLFADNVGHFSDFPPRVCGAIEAENGVMNIVNSSFFRNSGYRGGAVCLNDAVANLDHCTFNDSQAASDGGALFMFDSSAVLQNCTFAGNAALAGSGGALFASGGDVGLNDVDFVDNAASLDGGGLYLNGVSSSLTRCTWSANTAGLFGGGLYQSRCFMQPLVQCQFLGNSADSGGGLYNDGSGIELWDTVLADNSAQWFGGGMFNDSIKPEIFRCTFAGNTAYDGGGMYNRDEWGQWTTEVCTSVFDRNTATHDGAAIYNWRTSPQIGHCTFSANAAGRSGHSLFSTLESQPEVEGSIVWGDSAGQISDELASQTSVTESIVVGGYPGVGNLDQDPLFVDAANGDLHLQAGSPAIDSTNPYGFCGGISADGDHDRDGIVRCDDPEVPNGATSESPFPDRGAYEHPCE